MGMIDIHGHYMPLVNEPWFPVAKGDDGTLRVAGRPPQKVNPGLTDLSQQVESMKQLGFEFRVLNPAPQAIMYSTPPEDAARFCRSVNDLMAAEVAKYPGYFAAMANIPMQSVDLAVAELLRAVKELGMKGAQIGSNVNGKDLDDPSFEPFWKTVSDLDCVILMHSNNPAGGERMKDYYLANMIGNRFEVTLAACRLIFSGTMDRFPNLKVVVGQGGGYLPYAAGRMDHAWRAEEAPKKNVKVPPSTYIPRFYFDSITQRESEFNYLASQVGLDRVAIGTDAPFDMGDPDPNKSVMTWLIDDASKVALRATAKKLFRL